MVAQTAVLQKIKQSIHDREIPAVVGAASQHEPFVDPYFAQDKRSVGPRDIEDLCFLDTVFAKPLLDGFCHLCRMPVHRRIDDHSTGFRFLAAPA